MEFINEQYKDLDSLALTKSEEYINAEPFPSASFSEFFNDEMLSGVLEEFPDLSRGSARHFDNPDEKKYGALGEERFGDKTKAFLHYLNSEPFLKFLQTLTGIKEILIPDPYYVGGGLHEIKPGGLLKIHADFNKLSELGLDRRINVLVYLNKEWEEEYRGHFELWDIEMKNCVKKILPAFNTMALFNTTDFSYHGHPKPLTCPPDRSRKSLALYYYSNGRPEFEISKENKDHTTIFVARKGYESDLKREPKNSYLKRIILNITPPIIIKVIKKIF